MRWDMKSKFTRKEKTMTKTELANDMKRFCGCSFITRKKLADYMGKKDPHAVDKYLYGLDRVDGKDYFIPDVANVLKERCYV